MKSKTDPQLVFLVGINLLVLLSASVLSKGAFIDPYNLQSMASQLPELGLLAIGVMLAMSSGNGGIDLSGIALANLSGVFSATVVALFVNVEEAPLLFTLAFATIAICTGLVGGLVNGLLIARLGLTPILCTLGTQLLFTGLAVVLSGGPSVRVGNADLLMEIGNGLFFGVPISFLIFLLISLLVGAVLKYSPFGIRLFLMGTNPRAAHFAGFAQVRLLVTTYGLCGVMAGVKPEGGYGRMTCLFLSTTALQLLSSMLNFLDLSNFFRDCAWGALLLIFLAFGRYELFARAQRLQFISWLRSPPAPKSHS